ncbi:MAG: hypothetical protein FJW96_05240 [Actinobacteria bacterium]|nr:hypothetical protein [Actinomycetota bacterium]
MRVTRGRLLGGAAASALGAAGVYELVDRIGSKPARPAATGTPIEQHVLTGVRIVDDAGVEVVVPPLHHRVVTASVRADPGRRALRDARAELERLLAALDADYPPTPAGLGVTVAWGLPWFRTALGGALLAKLPRDRRATGTRGRDVLVLEDAERFPSDPDDTILEANDVAVLLRSDRLEAIEDAHGRLFAGVGRELFRVTSIRKGFAGGGFDGGTGIPKQRAVAAGITGAELIPDGAELFLGFTSTQSHALGPPAIANFETLGYVELGDSRLVGGTHMHLSRIDENLNAWYLNFDHRERLDTTFRPGLDVPPEQLTVPQGPDDVQTADQLRDDYARHRRIGHSGSLQPASRLDRQTVGPDGTVYPKGTAVPHRADFNTLDNPFAWSADPARDRMSDAPSAGVHFVIFNPTSDDFRRVRLAMDGVLPDGTELGFDARSRGQGFNAILRTTHRQNFLVPPRGERSFPLVLP